MDWMISLARIEEDPECTEEYVYLEDILTERAMQKMERKYRRIYMRCLISIETATAILSVALAIILKKEGII